MPTYRTQAADQSAQKKKRRRYPKRLPRDPRKLFRWAARGSDADYEKLRALARKARRSLPAHINSDAYERLENIDRLTMIEEIQAHEQHDVSAGLLLDACNWLLDKVPWGNWLWPVSAAQSTINAQKGDGLNEVDEQYARLVGATYGGIENRPYVIDHWKRQVQFDSSYVSVWDNLDGHRLIAVRGTEGSADIGEDILVGVTGRSTNLIGSELLDILAATPEGTVVDLAAHSLGTSLALESYSSAQIYNQIHETYLYNPAYSPFLRGKTDAYEKDVAVRYFINVQDPVSMGGVGTQSPEERCLPQRGQPAHGTQASAVAGLEQLPGPDLPRGARNPGARSQTSAATCKAQCKSTTACYKCWRRRGRYCTCSRAVGTGWYVRFWGHTLQLRGAVAWISFPGTNWKKSSTTTFCS